MRRWGLVVYGSALGGISYQRHQLLTVVSPPPHADGGGGDGVGLSHWPVPGIAAGVENGLLVLEDAVQ